MNHLVLGAELFSFSNDDDDDTTIATTTLISLTTSITTTTITTTTNNNNSTKCNKNSCSRLVNNTREIATHKYIIK